jgi:hypothetical protein
MFISILYMFRTAMCPSSGELFASVRRLVYVTLYRWPSDVQVCMRLIQTYSLCRLWGVFTLIYYSTSALHVSGNVFAHHQEHLTVFTVSGIVHPSCCQLVSRMSWNWTILTVYIVQFQLIRDTSWQQLGWTIPDTVNTVKCSWWWAQTARNM